MCGTADAETDGDVAEVRVGPEAAGRVAESGAVVPRTTAQWCSFNGFTRCSTNHAKTDGADAGVRARPESVGREAVPWAAVPRATAHDYGVWGWFVGQTTHTKTNEAVVIGGVGEVPAVRAAIDRVVVPGTAAH